jgi:hypothetical protein
MAVARRQVAITGNEWPKYSGTVRSNLAQVMASEYTNVRGINWWLAK